MESEQAMTTPESHLHLADNITVLVGSNNEQQLFTVHAARIVRRSKFFAAASSKVWMPSGAEKGSVDLSDEQPFIFDLYLRCLYSNEVELGDVSQLILREASDKETYIALDEPHRRYIRLYILADKLGDCRTANIVIDDFIGNIFRNDSAPDAANMRMAFDDSPETSPLRSLVVDLLAHSCLPGTYNAADRDEIPQAATHKAWFRLLRTIRDSSVTNVKEAFHDDFIHMDKKRYHRYDDLHPRPKLSTRKRSRIGTAEV